MKAALVGSWAIQMPLAVAWVTGTAPAPRTALRYDVEVLDEGRVELRVPFPLGTPVVV